MENTTAQSTPSNHMKASGVYAGSFSRQERTRYRYTATGWYSMIHPQLNCPRYLSLETITPEAYISTRMTWGSRLSRSGASATQRATWKAQPVEKSHIKPTAGNSSSQYQSTVPLPAQVRNPDRQEIPQRTARAGPSTVSAVSTPAIGSTARGNFTGRTRFKFLVIEWAPAETERSKKRNMNTPHTMNATVFSMPSRPILSRNPKITT